MKLQTILFALSLSLITSAMAYAGPFGAQGPAGDSPASVFAELTYDDVEAATNAVVRQRVRARRGFGQRVTGDVAFDLAVAYGVGIDTLTGVLEGSPASHGELFDAISGLVVGGAIVGAESSIGVGDIDALTPYDLDIDPAILERIQSTPLGVRIDAVRPFEVIDVAGLQSWAAANAATFEQLFVIYGPYAQAQVTGPIGSSVAQFQVALVAGGLGVVVFDVNEQLRIFDTDGDDIPDAFDGFPYDPTRGFTWRLTTADALIASAGPLIDPSVFQTASPTEFSSILFFETILFVTAVADEAAAYNEATLQTLSEALGYGASSGIAIPAF